MSTLVFHSRPGYDALTGLPDRAAFLAGLRAALGREAPLAVLFLDLDDFKLINDGFGHEAGDRLLIQVAQRLRGAVHDGDLVARLGGDEFTVLCADTDEAGATISAGRIRGALSAPFDVGGQRRHVRVSIGCRVAAPGEDTPDAVLRDADTAMYQAKAGGKDRVELFSDETRAKLLRRLDLEQRLRAAIEDEQLTVAFQPQIDLSSGHLVGAEALVRWSEASPAEFIPLAEETGLIAPLGEFVLRTATRTLVQLHADGLKPLTITVNVSTRQLEDPEFARIVQQALGEAGLEPRHLCLELTESALMMARSEALDALRECKALGVYVGIDDFGTGHSSLARLRELPVEVLKVDRSFVDGLGTEPEDSAVVAAILSLAHALGLHVVAEGVETPLQADQLIALGCAVAQGFLWSPAVPADELHTFSAVATTARRGHRGEKSLVDEMMHQLGIAKETRP
ncbi:EAL domain-containing protein [Solirubrobacter sp. CPCC 204708]|uniref:EAL domain-containing protein n=1 Tax=Solirubrobacter deserti TaxID=2282478 RepID=A0ABT4RSG2_9ACTN|nr:EAL domain-containing protein [Solirubrobacter deserti]MBE2316297.1 EAL domain-containing protein [Solirubrobacter deserti]MDA0141504.1 EAL domain-containing protein [Solirubrobacter deserti]